MALFVVFIFFKAWFILPSLISAVENDLELVRSLVKFKKIHTNISRKTCSLQSSYLVLDIRADFPLPIQPGNPHRSKNGVTSLQRWSTDMLHQENWRYLSLLYLSSQKSRRSKIFTENGLGLLEILLNFPLLQELTPTLPGMMTGIRSCCMW